MGTIVGSSFGRLTVVSRAGLDGTAKNSTWNCICECGTACVVPRPKLLSGRTRSCGCLRRDLGRARGTHHSCNTPEYRSWCAMKRRCLSSDATNYRWYGGRGIRVCERWRTSFSAFLEDMGPMPSTLHSIDRIDPNGHYEPGNCRWATKLIQLRNTRNTLLNEEMAREIRCLHKLGIAGRWMASLYGVHEATISAVIHGRNWRHGT